MEIHITMASGKVVEKLKSFVAVLRKERIPAEKAFLFGSYQTHMATEESDIDVLIVSEREEDQVAGKIWSLTSKVDSRIEPILVGKQRFAEDNISPIIDMVKKTGLRIA